MPLVVEKHRSVNIFVWNHFLTFSLFQSYFTSYLYSIHINSFSLLFTFPRCTWTRRRGPQGPPGCSSKYDYKIAMQSIVTKLQHFFHYSHAVIPQCVEKMTYVNQISQCLVSTNCMFS